MVSQHNEANRYSVGWEDEPVSTDVDEAPSAWPPTPSAWPPTAAVNKAEAPAHAISPHVEARVARPFPLAELPSHFPAFAARSALFQVAQGKSGESPPMLSGPVACHPQYQIERSGPRLGMWDKGVWEAAVAAAKQFKTIGPEFRLSLSSIVAAIGSSDTGKANLDKVFASLSKLAATSVSFKFANTGLGGSGMLLASARRERGQCIVALDPDFAVPAFSLNLQFRMRPARRRAMSAKVGQWLHDFVSINDNYEEGFELGHLRAMSGYGGEPGRFPSLVESAMRELLALPVEPERGDGGTTIKSFSVDRTGGGVDKWTLRFERGTEKDSYEMHAADLALKPMKGRPKTEAAPKPKRGGLAL